MDVTVNGDVEDVRLLLFDLSSRTRSLLPPAVVRVEPTNPAPSPKGNEGGVVGGRNDDDNNRNGGRRSDREQEGTLQEFTHRREGAVAARPTRNTDAMDTAIATESNNNNSSKGILANPHHGRRHETTNITLVVP